MNQRSNIIAIPGMSELESRKALIELFSILIEIDSEYKIVNEKDNKW